MKKLYKTIKLFYKYAAAFEGNCEKCGKELKPGTAEPYSSICNKCEKEKSDAWLAGALGFGKEKQTEVKTPEKQTIKIDNKNNIILKKIESANGFPYFAIPVENAGGIHKVHSIVIPSEEITFDPDNPWEPNSVDDVINKFPLVSRKSAEKAFDNAKLSGIPFLQELEYGYCLDEDIALVSKSPLIWEIRLTFVDDNFKIVDSFTYDKKTFSKCKTSADCMREFNLPDWFVIYSNIYGSSVYGMLSDLL